MAGFSVLGLGLAWTDPRGPNLLVGNVALAAVGFYLFIVPHEAAHALAARGLGFDIDRIVIGHGALLLRASLGQLRIEARAIPTSGLTYIIARSLPLSRWRMALVIAAGPATNLAIALGLWIAWGPWVERLEPIPGVSPVAAAILANLLVFVAAVFPDRVVQGERVLYSDGLRLWRILRGDFPSEDDERAHALWRWLYHHRRGQRDRAREALSASRDRWTDDPRHRLLELLSNLDELEDADALVAEGERFLELRDLDPALVTTAKNALAYKLFQRFGESQLERADLLSADAFEMLGWHPHIRDTRGIVLIASGRDEDGVALLQSALDDPDEQGDFPDDGRALSECMLAIGRARLGELQRALRHIARARRLDAACPMLEVAERAVAVS